MSKHFLKNWLPFALCYALIFYLSSLPGDGLEFLPLHNSDKFLHFSIYALLGMTLSRALYGQGRALRLKMRWFWLVLILAPLFGVADEWHQSFVPGRDVDVWDVVFDAAGMATAALWFWLGKTVFASKKSASPDQIRQKLFWYRLDLLLPILVLLGFEFYFASQPLHNAWITQKIPLPTFLAIYNGLVWFVVAVFWSRYWAWEIWWRSVRQKSVFYITAFVLGLTAVALTCQAMTIDFGDASFWIVVLAYVLGFSIYLLGLVAAQKAQARIFIDPHQGCQD